MLWRIAAYCAAAVGGIVLVMDGVLLAEHDLPLDVRVHQLLLSGAIVLAMCACTGRLVACIRDQAKSATLDSLYLRGLEAGREIDGADVAPMRRQAGR